jgi:RNA polymerase sporulation-specific sigma factor
MAKTYSILTSDEVGIPVSRKEFMEALNTLLYYWYDDGEYSFAEHRYIRGENNYLFPKTSERLSEAYRIHHNDIERQRQQDRRRIPTGIIEVPMTIVGDDGEERDRDIADETAERNIHAAMEHSELTERLRGILGCLKALDREVVALLYGLNGQAPMSKTACAGALGKNWRTVARAEERALAKLRTLAAGFEDYLV